jgi:acetolactate synthase I/II/III large subunit
MRSKKPTDHLEDSERDGELGAAPSPVGSTGSHERGNRRDFLKRVAIGSVASLALADKAAFAKDDKTDGEAPSKPKPGAVRDPSRPVPADPLRDDPDLGYVKDPGSDFMTDVIKSLQIDYVVSNPAHSFRGLHESLINYGGNKKPEWLNCLHEEIAVAMAHGYFKISGKPMIALMHSSVGLQHAAMAVYNAWCDKVPVIVVGGNDLDESKPERGKEIISIHSAQDPNTLVRDFTKWDDTPVSLQHFANSFVRAYKIAMTPPYGPVLVAIDSSYQQEPNESRGRLTIPPFRPTSPPQGESGAVREAARLLVRAESPLVVMDRAARSQRGVELLIELCELLQAPALDLRGRMNFPNNHYLNRQIEQAPALVGQADVVLCLELGSVWATVNSFFDNNKDGEGETRQLTKKGARVISISSSNLSIRSNYQDAQRFQPVDIEMAADAQSTLPMLIEEVKRVLTADRRRAIQGRNRALRAQWTKNQEALQVEAKKNWESSPVSTARLTIELLEQLKGQDWSLVGGSRHMVKWARVLWPFERYYQYIGLSGGDGRGYELPSAIGAALANRGTGRVSINLQSDGALMYTPQALWTAVHHKVPLLTVMMNNRAYHTEVEHINKVSRWRKRKPNLGGGTGPIGTMLENPAIDYAKMAQSMGMFAIGPITQPRDVAPAFAKALRVVKAGEPALVDIVTQPR